ncbi:hypothetical protein [Candidatus Accumulibacter sp. ACC003]|uniref:hypothetical protein n=1 Tax=Candidatus Accumulibacter sp. ACC003 TaxID=2823334 RepID=UPI0025BC4D8F|nr:hypothetical protein [Candidatus Accumulibacter sp. ACC003]
MGSLKAAQAEDLREPADAMRGTTIFLNQLAQHMEALAAALAGFELAYSFADELGMGRTAIEALRAAIFRLSPKAVPVFARWAVWDHDKPRDEQAAGWTCGEPLTLPGTDPPLLTKADPSSVTH